MYKHFLHNHITSSISSTYTRIFMALRTRTRFILVHSIPNTNVTDENMEPYHITTFRRTISMPQLTRKRSIRSSRLVSKYQRREKDEALTNKLYKLNMHTMRKKSARISMRLSNAFGLAAHTIDERFNFEEQRFRAIEKFLRLFVRNAYICMEALKVGFERIFVEGNDWDWFRRHLSRK